MLSKYYPVIKKLVFSNKKYSFMIFISITLMNFSEIVLVSLIAPIYDLLSETEFNFISKYINSIFIKIGFELNIISASVALIIFGLIISIMRLYSSWLVYTVKNNFMFDLSSKFTLSTLKADYNKLSKENSGNLINILTLEMERAGGSLLIIFNFFRDLILSLGLIVFLAIVSFKLLILFILIFLPLTLLIRYLHNRIEIASSKISTSNRVFLNHIKEIFDNIKDIKSMSVVDNSYNWVIKDAGSRLNAYKEASILSAIAENVQHFIMLLGLGVIVILSKVYLLIPSAEIILVIGGIVRLSPKITSAQRSLAEFLTLLPGFNLVTSMVSKLDKTQNINISKGSKIDLVAKSINVNNISFKYDGSSDIIKNFSCQINKGEITAIYGKSGSGKSTLLNMLLGLINPHKGEIILSPNSETPYHEYIFDNVGYLGQESGLFDFTIKENIKFFNDADNSEIDQLLKEFDLDSRFILDEELVGDKGISLSAGQRQRILLIRSLIKKPHLLFLDEATNNLDKKTENIIYQKLNDVKKDMFIILITHNKNVEEIADKVIYV